MAQDRRGVLIVTPIAMVDAVNEVAAYRLKDRAQASHFKLGASSDAGVTETHRYQTWKGNTTYRGEKMHAVESMQAALADGAYHTENGSIPDDYDADLIAQVYAAYVTHDPYDDPVTTILADPQPAIDLAKINVVILRDYMGGHVRAVLAAVGLVPLTQEV